MASDIKIEVIENVLQATSEENVIEVGTTTNVVKVHNADGLNGITPHIGENGNWFIGTKDTGVQAQGIKGEDGEDGKDGLTPYIGENGNWWVGETDLGVQAQGKQGVQGERGEQGEQGIQGIQGEQGETGKSAYAYAVEGGYKGTEEEFAKAFNNLGEIKNIMSLVYAGL